MLVLLSALAAWAALSMFFQWLFDLLGLRREVSS